MEAADGWCHVICWFLINHKLHQSDRVFTNLLVTYAFYTLYASIITYLPYNITDYMKKLSFNF